MVDLEAENPDTAGTYNKKHHEKEGEAVLPLLRPIRFARLRHVAQRG